MRWTPLWLSSLLLLALVGFTACSDQKRIGRTLNQADRVIYAKNYEDLYISITGEEVGKIVQAIASGKKESPLVAATPSFRLEFFKGTNRLASITNSSSVFWVGNKPFSDSTGTLQALYPRLRDQGRPMIP